MKMIRPLASHLVGVACRMDSHPLWSKQSESRRGAESGARQLTQDQHEKWLPGLDDSRTIQVSFRRFCPIFQETEGHALDRKRECSYTASSALGAVHEKETPS